MGLKVLNLENNCTIAEVKKFYDLFKDTFDAQQNCILNVSRSINIDSSFIQLILAAKKWARSKGLKCQIAAEVSKEFAECAWLCGISEKPTGTNENYDELFDTYLGDEV